MLVACKNKNNMVLNIDYCEFYYESKDQVIICLKNIMMTIYTTDQSGWCPDSLNAQPIKTSLVRLNMEIM